MKSAKAIPSKKIIRKITWQNIQSLQETQRLMDPSVLKKCAEKMVEADRILLFGMGASSCHSQRRLSEAAADQQTMRDQ